MTVESLARALRVAEDRLRARGLTGAQAFDALLPALEERLGLGPPPDDEAARAVAAAVPLDGRVDLLGLAYERFFADLFKGLRGQFFTPAPVAELLVDRVAVAPGEVVLDPTCGSGGLLVAAARSGARVRGIELDPRLARLAAVNLRLAGADARVRRADFFAAASDPVDVLVANPPFSVDVDDPAVLERFDLGRGRLRVSSDRLFVEAIEGWVRPGGRAGIVLPFSVLVNPSHADVRARIEAAWDRLGVCALPEGVFRPFGGAAGRACLLWLRRRPHLHGRVPTVWAELADPGYDVRLQRFRATCDEEVQALRQGFGWRELPTGAWTPPASGRGIAVAALADLREERVGRAGPAPVRCADLADADRTTGEVRPRTVPAIEGARVRIEAGDVLVARLRPNLGNVAVAPEPLLGSPEWIVLAPRRHRHWLLHALRAPAWRASLPVTGGQTRPRTSAGAVLASKVPWPGDALAGRIDALSARLLAERAALRDRLDRLQAAVDGFAAGDLDEEALEVAVAEVE